MKGSLPLRGRMFARSLESLTICTSPTRRGPEPTRLTLLNESERPRRIRSFIPGCVEVTRTRTG